MPLKFLLFSIYIMAAGCASVAHRPYICQDGMNNAYSGSWLYFLGGAVLQQGGCAVLEPLKIEYGEYYLQHHDIILADLNRKNDINREFGAINNFAKAFNCSDEVAPQFVDMVVDNKIFIFGETQENGSRTVTKNIQSKIQNDELLRKNCPF